MFISQTFTELSQRLAPKQAGRVLTTALVLPSVYESLPEPPVLAPGT